MTAPTGPRRVLAVDDDPLFRRQLGIIFQGEADWVFESCASGAEAMRRLHDGVPDLLLLDLGLPDRAGEDLLEIVAAAHPTLSIVVISANDAVESVVRCLNRGAVDYLVKPTQPGQVLAAARGAVEQSYPRQEWARVCDSMLAEGLRHPEAFAGIVTRNERMLRAMRYLEAVVCSPRPIHITGEAGTGRERFARAVHRLAGRQGPFLRVDLGTGGLGGMDCLRAECVDGSVVAEPLLDRAADGTLYFAGVDELDETGQGTLLSWMRMMEGRLLARRCTVVLSSTRDLRELVDRGVFRIDLCYRLGVHAVALPPLRERPEDLPLLIERLLTRAAEQLGLPRPTCDAELAELFLHHAFPGNVAELQALILDAVATQEGGKVDLVGLHQRIQGPPTAVSAPVLFGSGRLPDLREVQRRLIEEALRRCGQNRTRAAELLGISRQALVRRLGSS